MLIDEWENIIQSSNGVLTYFSAPGCGVCQVLKPQIKELISNEFPKVKLIEIDASTSLVLCGQLSIHTIPAIVITFEGKEFYRFAKNFSVHDVRQAIQRPYSLIF